ncbi:hypothetical protein ABKN59_000816 [Abortiporus biennis]
MSDKHVRKHGNVSNRAKPTNASERKVVYKSVLDNPFKISWPKIPSNVQNMAFAGLMNMLNGVSDFNEMKKKACRQKRRLVSEPDLNRKKRKVEKPTSLQGTGTLPIETSDGQPSDTLQEQMHQEIPTSTQAPVILEHITVGINEVTKKLEALSRALREHAVNKGKARAENISSSTQVVFVCRPDINPEALVSHLPSLVAACNSARPKDTPSITTLLVSLPAGSEVSLADALGVRRAAVVLVNDTAPGYDAVKDILSSIPVLVASWLGTGPTTQASILAATHIKQIRTTAPKDMKAAKERRQQGRSAAKERRKELAKKAAAARVVEHTAEPSGS